MPPKNSPRCRIGPINRAHGPLPRLELNDFCDIENAVTGTSYAYK